MSPRKKLSSQKKTASKLKRSNNAKAAVVAKKLYVRTRQGLHARPAALFVRVANRFKSKIILRKGKRQADGKSIMGVLTLAAQRGSTIEISAKGSDRKQAIQALEQIISRSETPAVVTVTKRPHPHGRPRRS